jgi:disulfide bond formation protein DsbB
MSTRGLYCISFAAVCILLLISLYLQIYVGMTPCPLCVMQRLSFGILGIVFLIGSIVPHKRYISMVLALLSNIVCIMGIFFSGRNIWLQHFPIKDNQGCEVSLQYMIETFPFKTVLNKILLGGTDCSIRGFEFL